MTSTVPSGNAYVDALPPIREDPRQVQRALGFAPDFNPEERGLSHTLRRYCVARLNQYFKASSRQWVVAERFDMMIRHGYLGRNPADRAHDARIFDAAEQMRQGCLLSPGRPLGVNNGARSATLLGFAGMGKTMTIEQILSTYPQVVDHGGDPADQIVWLKLDCPTAGSARALCIDFFEQVDGALGRSFYAPMFAGPSASVEMMLAKMAQVANIHALGCLVIDEIQHLLRTSAEDSELINFLTTLVNKMGVPVLFIGTLEANKLFRKTDRLSRRALGMPQWSRFERGDAEWVHLVTDLWRYQWTDHEAELTDEILDLLYDETQGIVDLLVKLFTLTQMRVILWGQRNAHRSDDPPPELITAEWIRKTVADEFLPVSKMIADLRSGKPHKLAHYEDLAGFQATHAQKLDHFIDPGIERVIADAGASQADTATEMEVDDDAMDSVVRVDFRRRGYADDVIEVALRRARSELNGSAPFLSDLMEKVRRELVGDPSSSQEDDGVVEPIPLKAVEGDLRVIAEAAADAGRLVYDALREAGLGGPEALRLVA
jgi:hypothetical protein